MNRHAMFLTAMCITLASSHSAHAWTSPGDELHNTEQVKADLPSTTGTLAPARIYTFVPDDVLQSNTSIGYQNFNSLIGTQSYSYVIEDFEDTQLIPGLLISYDNQPTPSQAVLAEDLSTNYPDAVWNGNSVFIPVVRDGGAYYDVVFTFNYAVTSFGIGVGDTESPVELLVNGVSFGDIQLLPNYTQVADNQREIYIRVDANEGEQIQSITLRPMNTGMAFGDGLLLDHIAVQAAECVGDTDRDGDLDFFDVSAFINAFQAGCP